jgi:cbb3-type cytochrome oxidase maturation protein
MNVLLLLIAASLLLGVAALVVFLWSLRDGQYEDLDGAANRVVFDHDHPKRRE